MIPDLLDQALVSYSGVVSEKLVSEITRLLSVGQDIRPLVSERPRGSGLRLTSLKGLGKDIWKDGNAQQYVDGLRDEWHRRP